MDFAPIGRSEQGNELFEACPGGAPCNVLACLNKLGKKTAFVGKVGPDQFGKLLRSLLNDLGINTSHLHVDDKVNTTLAFVHTMPGGERDFSFYRNPGADMLLTESEIHPEFIQSSRAFHFGTISMTHEGVRAATEKAVSAAKDGGLLISFDPNLRPPLWKNVEDAREPMEYGLEQCDLAKVADNEVEFLTGSTEYEKAGRLLAEQYHIPLLLVTLGPGGSMAFWRGEVVKVEGFHVDSIENTGAGDTFCGCAISGVLDTGLENLTTDRLREILSFANAAAALVTTRKGAIKSMPARKDVSALLDRTAG